MGMDNEQSVLLRLQQINVFAPVALSRAMSRYWREVVDEGKVRRQRKKKHQIAVTSSVAALMGSPMMSAYSMSKAGINRYLEAMRVELVDEKVDFNVVCPGPVEITQDSHDALGSADGALQSR